MRKIYFLALILFAFNSYAQHQFNAELNLGYSFQEKTEINNQDTNSVDALGVRLGLNYQQVILKQAYFEVGTFLKYNRSGNGIEGLDFTADNLKFQVPLYFGYNINEKLKVSAGVGIENNKDFSDIDFKRKENLRYDFLTKFVYDYGQKMKFSLYTHWSLSKTSDIYTISSPKNGIYLGVIYPLIKNKK
ncbi:MULTISPECIES: outer membrane beta-barrel protein [unclassified Cellulophaga]|uniref:outer membrane beta-barrel protein n=1 Tax=unclassified Cellulophaga TaxID=2634405 RepID=UPI0026E1F6B9|nr:MULTISPECIES: outer membrane beta-barrel protein [unclassified Cellulophaga]MDO6490080.1 outer membrane beta-barrel protein [Cellulophaga sp. 2_MG-2023]MDO6494726.1 outer membrane beta-barrel protein [Cellulophaga sp. 3_MG-2023]